MSISSFLPNDLGTDDYTYDFKNEKLFLYDLARAFQLLYINKLSHLILDLRGNGGGYICLAMETLRFLFPLSVPQHEIFDIKRCPLTDKLAQKASLLPTDIYSMFAPTKYFLEQNNAPFTNDSWLIPGVPHVRGGISSNYSLLLTDDCSFMDIPPLEEKYRIPPDRLLVLSDGTCGSACALTLRNIQQNKFGKIVVVGGIRNRPQQGSSFFGGFVFSLNDLFPELKLLNLLNDPLAPQPFLTSASLSWTLWEGYAYVGPRDIPLQFVFEPSDYRIMYTSDSVRSSITLYEDVTSLFDV